MRPNKDLIEERFKESIDIWVSDACPQAEMDVRRKASGR